MARIDLILFDIGGVLGTDGWDREQRAAAADRFGLDAGDFEYRHQDAVGWWEEGRMTMDEYLDRTVFFRPRPFTRDDFAAFMFAQSRPNPEMLRLARTLASGGYRMMTLNNESPELNRYRIDTFGLREIFTAFLSSCYLGVRKPTPAMYTRALGVAHADPRGTVLIDDREQNLRPAQVLGMHTIRATTTAEVRDRLVALDVTLAL